MSIAKQLMIHAAMITLKVLAFFLHLVVSTNAFANCETSLAELDPKGGRQSLLSSKVVELEAIRKALDKMQVELNKARTPNFERLAALLKVAQTKNDSYQMALEMLIRYSVEMTSPDQTYSLEVNSLINDYSKLYPNVIFLPIHGFFSPKKYFAFSHSTVFWIGFSEHELIVQHNLMTPVQHTAHDFLHAERDLYHNWSDYFVLGLGHDRYDLEFASFPRIHLRDGVTILDLKNHEEQLARVRSKLENSFEFKNNINLRNAAINLWFHFFHEARVPMSEDGLFEYSNRYLEKVERQLMLAPHERFKGWDSGLSDLVNLVGKDRSNDEALQLLKKALILFISTYKPD